MDLNTGRMMLNAERVGLWAGATGGGDAAAYLRWLAAQWEVFRVSPAHEADRGPDGNRWAFDRWLRRRFEGPVPSDAAIDATSSNDVIDGGL